MIFDEINLMSVCLLRILDMLTICKRRDNSTWYIDILVFLKFFLSLTNNYMYLWYLFELFRQVEPGSPESLFLGNKILSALTDAYAHMIFGSGIIHGDPHPGNIFVLKDGEVALLDCGQVKQINTKQRINLASLIIMVNQWELLNNKLGNLKSMKASQKHESGM